MGTVSIKDQNQKIIYGIDIAICRRDEPSKELFRLYPDLAGHTDFYYAALGVNTHNHLPADQKYDLTLNRVEGLNSDWKKYDQNIIIPFDNVLKDEGLDIVLTRTVGNNCPLNHDKVQFENWFWDIVKKHNEPNATNHALVVLVEELKNCGMAWQNQYVYPADRWRPRIFLGPLNPPNYDSPWLIDCGDDNMPWKLTFRY